MKWYYESNGNPHGPVEEAEMRQLKDAGKLMGDSLVWRQGMKDWTPLNAVGDFAPQPDPHSIASKPLSPISAEENPEIEPQNHLTYSDRENSIPSREFSSSHSRAESSPESGLPSRTRPEWEHFSEVGPLNAFFISLRDILIDPRETFRNLATHGEWGMPLLFLLIAEILGNISMVLTIKQVPLSASPTMVFLRQALQMESGEGMLFYSTLASLFMLPLATLIKTVIIHASLKFIGRSSRPFSTTFRTLCYAWGAGSMLWGVPLLAVSVANAAGDAEETFMALFLAAVLIGIWSAWINLRALASAHDLSIPRTIVSVLGPPFLAALLSALFLGAIATLNSP